ncbi:alpha/beta hydrolase fold protein [Rhizoctonia solani AG-3 Rhs1AP]|uniref:Alpha/beta hydrolase fold protein n=1 Tax=Rhizoctonia solani AG-3 Rhs1AP TaxID=1086054 RepID=X8IZA7_9AGAM|nr:alpha/beta hydrolase fold protein [Rhizoctonia solani AG-3 Rhs1AP]
MWPTLWIACAGLAVSTVWPAYAHIIHTRQTSNTSAILWTTCPDVSSTQCTFFDVPMDYTNPDNNSTVSIFLRKYPCTVPTEQRLGSILFNPGGPGGSGSGVIAVLGEAISTMVDGRYDIIGFDPRAVNLTGPSTACHDVELKFAERAHQLHTQGVPLPHVGGLGEIAHVARLSAIQSSHHAACVQNGNYDMLRNSGTVAVVKDMERIVGALGEDGLNFIGYSYGSILGTTFAAMRPNLVKRMVLDGIYDSESYFNDALEWGRSGIQDSHKTFAGFISTCIDTGPAQCVLASTRDNKTETAEGLTKRLNTLYIKLGKEPLVVGDSLTGPGILQAHNMQLIIFSLRYNPHDWPALAQILLLMEQGDGRDLFPGLSYGLVYGAIPKVYTQNVFNRSMQIFPSNTRESGYPVMCSDLPQLNITVEGYVD